jgi:hypothetical protein
MSRIVIKCDCDKAKYKEAVLLPTAVSLAHRAVPASTVTTKLRFSSFETASLITIMQLESVFKYRDHPNAHIYRSQLLGRESNV